MFLRGCCWLLVLVPVLVHAKRGGECTALMHGFDNGVISITSQSDMDNLVADCSSIIGSINIRCGDALSESESIQDLQVFAFVTEISGYLRIQNCDYLTSLEGFASLQTIRGETLYEAANGESGYALYIRDNGLLTSLAGLNNLRLIDGGTTSAGRVSIQSNTQMCYTDKVNWERIVGSNYWRLVAVEDGTSINCDAVLCHEDCKEYCFGEGRTNCESTGSDDDNTHIIIIVVLVVFMVVFAVVAVFVYLWMTDRCGCRLRCGGKDLQLGTLGPKDSLRSDAKLLSDQDLDDEAGIASILNHRHSQSSGVPRHDPDAKDPFADLAFNQQPNNPPSGRQQRRVHPAPPTAMPH
eukprot:m.67143 g.67143  ORF g.67143 m.67143 type:complete len:352 (+) comp19780_c0_seq4:42-1097(+)